jgi:hypothetical protein
MSSLRLINETTASSGVSFLNVSNVFTDDYEIFKITLNDIDTSGTGWVLARFINDNGSTIASSVYEWSGLTMQANTSFTAEEDNNDAEFAVVNFGDSDSNARGGFVGYVFNARKNDEYKFLISQSVGERATGMVSNKAIGLLKSTNKISGISFFLSSQTFDSLKVRVYGIRSDS